METAMPLNNSWYISKPKNRHDCVDFRRFLALHPSEGIMHPSEGIMADWQDFVATPYSGNNSVDPAEGIMLEDS